jgi:hypothetical protein
MHNIWPFNIIYWAGSWYRDEDGYGLGPSVECRPDIMMYLMILGPVCGNTEGGMIICNIMGFDRSSGEEPMAQKFFATKKRLRIYLPSKKPGVLSRDYLYT